MPNAERNMWAKVLWTQISDLIGPNANNRTMAERWVGTYPSKDFSLVCSYAGLDPKAVHEKLVALINGDETHRKAFKDRMTASDGRSI